MNRALLVIFGLQLFVVFCLFAQESPAGFLKPLFRIDRSLNRNQVVYEARLSGTGFLSENPVNVYWRILEEGDRTEGLTPLEEGFAYGVGIRFRSEKEVRFTLKALPKRVLSLRLLPKGEVVAVLTIEGKESRVDSIYIHSVGSGIFSSVKYVDVRGRALSDGNPVHERIDPKKL